MKKFKTIALCSLLAFLVSACGEDVPIGSPPWKETDKHLNCQQLMLEMNDARFWNKLAHSKAEMGITDYLWPVGYIGRQSSASDAISATQGRIDNLNNIYGIKGCRNPYPGMNLPPR